MGEKKYPPGSVLGQTRKRLPKKATSQPSSVPAHKPWVPKGPALGRAGRFSELPEDERDFPNLPAGQVKGPRFGSSKRGDAPRAPNDTGYISPYAAKNVRDNERGKKTAAFHDVHLPSDALKDNVPFYDPQDVSSKTAPVFGSEIQRPAAQHQDTPSSADYDPNNNAGKVNSALPAYKADRFRDAGEDTSAHAHLDPFADQTKREHDRGNKTAAFHDVHLPSDALKDNVPFYDPQDVSSKTAPVFGSEIQRPAAQHQDTPSSADYDPNNNAGKVNSALPAYKADRFRDAGEDTSAHAHLDPFADQTKRENDRGNKTAAFHDVHLPSDALKDNVPFYDPQDVSSKTAPVFGSEIQRPAAQHQDTPSSADYDPNNNAGKVNSALPAYKADRFRDAGEDTSAHAHLDPFADQTKRENDRGNKTAAFHDVHLPSDALKDNVPFYDPQDVSSKTAPVFGSEIQRPAAQHQDTPSSADYDPNNNAGKVNSALPAYKADRFRDAGEDTSAHAHLDPFADQTKRENDRGNKTAAFHDVHLPSDALKDNVPFYDPQDVSSKTAPVFGSEIQRPAAQHQDTPSSADYDPNNNAGKVNSALPAYKADRFRDAGEDTSAHAHLDPFADQTKRENDRGNKTAAFHDVHLPSDALKDNVPFYDPQDVSSKTAPVFGSEIQRPAAQHQDTPSSADYDPNNNAGKVNSALPAYKADRFRDAGEDTSAHAHLDPFADQTKRENDRGNKTAAFHDVHLPSDALKDNVPFYDPQDVSSKTAPVFGSEIQRPAAQHQDTPSSADYDPNNNAGKVNSALPAYKADRFRDAGEDTSAHAHLDPFADQTKRENDRGNKTAAFHDVHLPSDALKDNVPFYDPQDVSSKTAPVFGSEIQRPAAQHQDTPSSADYDPNNNAGKVNSALPAYKADRFRDAGEDTSAHAHLDPFADQTKRENDRGNKTAAFHDVHLPSDALKDNVPFYDPQDVSSKTAPVFGSEIQRPAAQHQDTPSSADYDPNNNAGKVNSALPAYKADRFRDAGEDTSAHAHLDPFADQTKRENDRGNKTAAFHDVHLPSDALKDNVPFYDPQDVSSKTAPVFGSEIQRPAAQHQDTPSSADYDPNNNAGKVNSALPAYKADRFRDAGEDTSAHAHLDPFADQTKRENDRGNKTAAFHDVHLPSDALKDNVPFYDPQDVSSKTAPVFGSEIQRPAAQHQDTPSSADYDPNNNAGKVNSALPAYKADRFRDAGEDTSAHAHLDPFADQTKRENDRGNKTAAFHDVHLPSDALKDNVPFYDPQDVSSKTAPVFGSEIQRPAAQHQDTPSSADYDPNNNAGKVNSALPAYKADRFRDAGEDTSAHAHLDPFADQTKRENDRGNKTAAFHDVHLPSDALKDNVPFYDPQDVSSKTAPVFGSEIQRPAAQHQDTPSSADYDPNNNAGKVNSALPAYKADRFRDAGEDTSAHAHLDPFADQTKRENDRGNKTAAFHDVHLPSDALKDNVPFYDPQDVSSKTAPVFGSEIQRPAAQHQDTPSSADYDPNNNAGKVNSALPAYKADRFRDAGEDTSAHAHLDPFADQTKRENDRGNKTAAFHDVHLPSDALKDNVPFYDPQDVSSKTAPVFGSEIQRPAAQHQDTPSSADYDPNNNAGKVNSALPAYKADRFRDAGEDTSAHAHLDPFADQTKRENDRGNKTAAFHDVHLPSDALKDNVPFYDPQDVSSKTAPVFGSEIQRPAAQHQDTPSSADYDPNNNAGKVNSALPAYKADRFRDAGEDTSAHAHLDPFADQTKRENDRGNKTAAFHDVHLPSDALKDNVPFYDPQDVSSKTAPVFGSEIQRPAAQHQDTPSSADYDPNNNAGKVNSALPAYKADRFRDDGEDTSAHAHLDPFADQTKRENDRGNKTAAFHDVHLPSDALKDNVPFYDPQDVSSKTAPVFGSEIQRPAAQHQDTPSSADYDPNNNAGKVNSALPAYKADRFRDAGEDTSAHAHLDPFADQTKRENDRGNKTAAFHDVHLPSDALKDNVPFYDPQDVSSKTAPVFGSEIQRPAAQHQDTPSSADYDPNNNAGKVNSALPAYKADRFRDDGEDTSAHAHLDPFADQTKRENEKNNPTSGFKNCDRAPGLPPSGNDCDFMPLPADKPLVCLLHSCPFVTPPLPSLQADADGWQFRSGSNRVPQEIVCDEEPVFIEYKSDFDPPRGNAAPFIQSGAKRFPESKMEGSAVTYLDDAIRLPEGEREVSWMFKPHAAKAPPAAEPGVPFYTLPSKTTPGVGFSKDARFKYSLDEAPGPADYVVAPEHDGGMSSASMQFKDKRFKENLEETPGFYGVKGMQ